MSWLSERIKKIKDDPWSKQNWGGNPLACGDWNEAKAMVKGSRNNNRRLEELKSGLPRVSVQKREGRGCEPTVQAFFDRLEEHLIKFINDADMIFGCVAWLTNFNVLDALADVSGGCQIVVQKEDFLRPDYGSHNNWKTTLRKKYEALHGPCAENWMLPKIAGCANPENSDISCDVVMPIQCAGNYNRDKKPAFPRMHHKFFVSMKKRTEPWPQEYYDNFIVNFGDVVEEYEPDKVWTGSFNPSANGTKSRENAVVISDPRIAEAYLEEWSAVYFVSEFLDWEKDWSAPEFRLGS